MRKAVVCFCCIMLLAASVQAKVTSAESGSRWPVAKANKWYREQPWLIGCNFTPSTAVNQLEMWQAETFDPETIDRELGWAASIGFNTVRVYLHDLAWQADPDGFKKRISRFLKIADKRGIRPMFVIFDDCWNDNPKVGKQPEPIPGVHNSRWVRSPGNKFVIDPNSWSRLELYVKDVVGSFRKDERILMWDLYNEPGNSGLGNKSLPLLKAAFRWARQAKPMQPLTVGVWSGRLKELNDFQVQASDIISFHNYGNADSVRRSIKDLKPHGRPIVCTEYLSRPRGSRFQTHLPIFKAETIGCYNWGLVNGKIQTIYPWGSRKGSPEPKVWFHDILRKDGTPFDPNEVEFIKRLALAKRKAQ